jgi:hypothetical protein
MNSFDLAREAIELTRAHHCNPACNRNADGHCLHKLYLWRNQRSVVLKWNAPATEESAHTVTVDRGYL